MFMVLRQIPKITLTAVIAAVLASGLLASAAPAQAAPTSTAQDFTLRNELNHKCLEVMGFNNANHAPAGMFDCWGGANQKWYWDGQQLRSVFNNKCLEILGFNNKNHAPVGMVDCWGGANQRWYQV